MRDEVCECGHDKIHHLSFGEVRERLQDCDVPNCECRVWTPTTITAEVSRETARV